MNPSTASIPARAAASDALQDRAVGAGRRRRPRANGPAIAALLVALALPWGHAQAPATGEAAGPGAANVAEAAAEAAEPAADEVRVTEVPAIASFGVAFGFPAYRTAGVTASVQAGAVGAAVHLAWGTAGFAAGVQARAYPPVPWPLPTYLAAGADLYAGRFAPHVALGAHVPVAERWRLDLEGGVAWTPLLDARQMVPYASLGVSYAVAVGLAPSSSSSTAGADAAPADHPGAGRCVPGEPDPALLDAAVDGTLATVVVAYSGSVIERLSGREVEASGTAEVDFRWGGCAWARRALRT